MDIAISAIVPLLKSTPALDLVLPLVSSLPLAYSLWTNSPKPSHVVETVSRSSDFHSPTATSVSSGPHGYSECDKWPLLVAIIATILLAAPLLLKTTGNGRGFPEQPKKACDHPSNKNLRADCGDEEDARISEGAPPPPPPDLTEGAAGDVKRPYPMWRFFLIFALILLLIEAAIGLFTRVFDRKSTKQTLKRDASFHFAHDYPTTDLLIHPGLTWLPFDVGQSTAGNYDWSNIKKALVSALFVYGYVGYSDKRDERHRDDALDSELFLIPKESINMTRHTELQIEKERTEAKFASPDLHHPHGSLAQDQAETLTEEQVPVRENQVPAVDSNYESPVPGSDEEKEEVAFESAHDEQNEQSTSMYTSTALHSTMNSEPEYSNASSSILSSSASTSKRPLALSPKQRRARELKALAARELSTRILGAVHHSPSKSRRQRKHSLKVKIHASSLPVNPKTPSSASPTLSRRQRARLALLFKKQKSPQADVVPPTSDEHSSSKTNSTEPPMSLEQGAPLQPLSSNHPLGILSRRIARGSQKVDAPVSREEMKDVPKPTAARAQAWGRVAGLLERKLQNE
ncbi:hypothetical protein D9758_002213 [Tetrapyrgos nigripes]|uniref:Uncharacterized protein n=1 Tax=Tetrapyrgos nigripes TaxID=182062 RepID=A0A8H5GP51_9AGAR|nr:hypothetical protein D9758_002213 [Tetrapyrgos nigripes]